MDSLGQCPLTVYSTSQTFIVPCANVCTKPFPQGASIATTNCRGFAFLSSSPSNQLSRTISWVIRVENATHFWLCYDLAVPPALEAPWLCGNLVHRSHIHICSLCITLPSPQLPHPAKVPTLHQPQTHLLEDPSLCHWYP